MYVDHLFTTESSLHFSSLLRYSLTEEGLALAERLESAEHGTNYRPAWGTEEAKSEGEGEEEGPQVVDLTGSDDGEEEEMQSCVGVPRSEAEGLIEKAQSSKEANRKGCLLPGTYEIILCVDFIETTG